MVVKVRRDLTSGLALAGLSAILWLMIPRHIVVEGGGSSNARLFPRIIVGAMFFLSAYLVIGTLLRRSDKVLLFDLKKEGRILLYLLGLVLFTLLLEFAGFIAAAVVVSALSLRAYKASRRAYLFMGGFIALVYLMFTAALGIPLP